MQTRLYPSSAFHQITQQLPAKRYPVSAATEQSTKLIKITITIKATKNKFEGLYFARMAFFHEKLREYCRGNELGVNDRRGQKRCTCINRQYRSTGSNGGGFIGCFNLNAVKHLQNFLLVFGTTEYGQQVSFLKHGTAVRINHLLKSSDSHDGGTLV